MYEDHSDKFVFWGVNLLLANFNDGHPHSQFLQLLAAKAEALENFSVVRKLFIY